MVARLQLANEALDGLIAARKAMGIDQILPDCLAVAPLGSTHLNGIAILSRHSSQFWAHYISETHS